MRADLGRSVVDKIGKLGIGSKKENEYINAHVDFSKTYYKRIIFKIPNSFRSGINNQEFALQNYLLTLLDNLHYSTFNSPLAKGGFRWDVAGVRHPSPKIWQAWVVVVRGRFIIIKHSACRDFFSDKSVHYMLRHYLMPLTIAIKFDMKFKRRNKNTTRVMYLCFP